MHRKIPYGLIWLLMVFISTARMGLGTEVNQDKKKKDKRTGVVVLPVVFYQPETRIGAGVGGLITYRAKDSSESARPSSLYFQAYYTQNKQYGIELKPEIYLKNEIYLINAYLKTSKFPSKFWGIGNQTPDEAEEDYTPRIFNFDFSVQRRILSRERFYLGVQYKFENYKIFELESDGELAKGTITGCEGGRLSSLGFILNWDRRDNIFFPHTGNYLIGTGGTIFFSPIQAIISR